MTEDMTDMADIARAAFEVRGLEIAGAEFSAEARDFGLSGRGIAVAMKAVIGGVDVHHMAMMRIDRDDDGSRAASVCGQQLADWARIRCRVA